MCFCFCVYTVGYKESMTAKTTTKKRHTRREQSKGGQSVKGEQQHEKPWYVKIKEELDERDRKCAQLDPNDVYKRPERDPYSYGDLNVFTKKHQFIPRRDCKYVPPNGASLLKDRYQRFFRNIRGKKQCDLVNGTWSPSSVNRAYRYEDGVCWKNKEHAHCSQYEVPELLRPGHEKLPNRHSIIASGSKKCNIDPKCSWTKFEHSFDCISNEVADKIKRRASSSPPAEMPSDITGSKNIEQFLFDFYTKDRVNNRDVIAPATQVLIGEGNRCAPPQGKAAAAAAQASQTIHVEEEDIDIYGFPIKRKTDRIKIPDATELIDETAEKPLMVPSVPQSVINMIMKNFAAKETSGNKVTNKGLLAWHSTGSGKTFTACGVIDAFWKSKRDIIFVSSLDALASNPPSTFHEGLLNIYPDFQKEPFAGKTRDESLQRIGSAFEARNVRFLSFAKLSNRVKKTIESGAAPAPAHNKQRGGLGRIYPGLPKKKNPKRRNLIGKPLFPVDPPAAPKAAKAKAAAPAPIKRKITIRKPEPSSPPRAAQGKLSKDDFVDLNNTVLVVDEVHNLFRPLPNQKAQHDYLKKQLLDPRRFPGLKMVILSATPGDSIEDVLMLLNMIRDPSHPEIKAPSMDDPKSMDQFRSDVRGLISYFDMSGDLTRFPQVYEQEHIPAPMDPSHFEKYVEAYLKTVKEKKVTEYDKLAKDHQVAKYWAPARKYSNMLFTFEKGMKATEFSSKLPVLLQKIRSFPTEKHYVYSAFSDNRNKGWSSQGILAIANMMEQELKYKKFSLDEAKYEPVKDLKGKTIGYRITKLPDKRPRFLLVTLKELGGESADGKISSSAGEKLKKMLAVYNHPENRYGEIIHVMLASNAFNEGIDLKAVRHIHFFEPLVTMASDKQTIGRAARFCSHAELSKEKGEWKVQIHRYMSQYPMDVTLNTKTNAVDTKPHTGPTEDEAAQIAAYETRITDTKRGIEDLTTQLVPLKGITSKSKDTEAVARKEDLKARVQFGKDQIKKDEDEMKQIKKHIEARDKEAAKADKEANKRKKSSKFSRIDPSTIKMIDEQIFEESRSRVKELMLVYQMMKESAVDCMLLKTFHAQSGNKYECAKFEPKPLIPAPIDFKAKNTTGLDGYKKLNKFFF